MLLSHGASKSEFLGRDHNLVFARHPIAEVKAGTFADHLLQFACLIAWALAAKEFEFHGPLSVQLN